MYKHQKSALRNLRAIRQFVCRWSQHEMRFDLRESAPALRRQILVQTPLKKERTTLTGKNSVFSSRHRVIVMDSEERATNSPLPFQQTFSNLLRKHTGRAHACLPNLCSPRQLVKMFPASIGENVLQHKFQTERSTCRA